MMIAKHIIFCQILSHYSELLDKITRETLHCWGLSEIEKRIVFSALAEPG